MHHKIQWVQWAEWPLPELYTSVIMMSTGDCFRDLCLGTQQFLPFGFLSPPPPLPNSWSPCRELSRSLIACLCFTKSKKHTSCVLGSPIQFDSPFQEACCSWRSVLDFPFQPHTFQRGWAQDRQGTLSWVSSAICGDYKHLVVLWYLLRISVLIMFAQTSESCLGVFYFKQCISSEKDWFGWECVNKSMSMGTVLTRVYE